MSEHFRLRLVRSHMIAPLVRHMAFVRDDGAPFPFVPGQFIQIHFEHHAKALRRSYSVATRPDDPANPEGLLEIAVSYVEGGAATALLSALEPGGTIDARGPYGRFVLHADDANARYLLIATGTGVTPYRAMLADLQRRIAERGQQVALLFGARTPEELLYGSEFEAFARRVPGFRFYACFSRSPRDEPLADDRAGYVQTVLPELRPDPTRDIAYLCGNPNMVDACFAALKDAGLPIPHIRREKYVSPPEPRGRALPVAAE